MNLINNEKWSYNTVSFFIDEETGEQIDKSQLGDEYTKYDVLDVQLRTDFENKIKTIIRTIACKKLPAKQLKLEL